MHNHMHGFISCNYVSIFSKSLEFWREQNAYFDGQDLSVSRASTNLQGWVVVHFLDSHEEKAKDTENTYPIKLHRIYVFHLLPLSEKSIGYWNFKISEHQPSPRAEFEMQGMKNIDSPCLREDQSCNWNLYLLGLFSLYYLCT